MQTNRTLGDLRRDGWTLLAVCVAHGCGRGVPLDLDALIARFGAGHFVINDTEIKRRLTCRCGHKGGDLRMIPYGVTGSGRLYPGGRMPVLQKLRLLR